MSRLLTLPVSGVDARAILAWLDTEEGARVDPTAAGLLRALADEMLRLLRPKCRNCESCLTCGP